MPDNKSLLSNRALMSIIFFPNVLIFAILNLKDINFVLPPFEQLSTSSGIIGFTHSTYFKGTPPFYHLYSRFAHFFKRNQDLKVIINQCVTVLRFLSIFQKTSNLIQNHVAKII